MSDPVDIREEKLWSRPQIDRERPNRRVGGFYRTAEDGRAGVGGVPLTAAEDAVVAAVRLAYNVAEEQIERSTRLGRRLREAGDRAVGPGSDRETVDATEKLLFDAAMSALTWVEALAAEEGSPAKRLVTAQYRILGSLLGVTPQKPSREAKKQETSPASQFPMPQGPGLQDRAPPSVKVVLQGECKRPVQLHRFDRLREAPFESPIHFYSVEQIESEVMTARLTVDPKGSATLTIEVGRHAVPGRWKAAICDPEGMQLGIIEVEL
jgi:hypothetical protein